MFDFIKNLFKSKRKSELVLRPQDEVQWEPIPTVITPVVAPKIKPATTARKPTVKKPVVDKTSVKKTRAQKTQDNADYGALNKSNSDVFNSIIAASLIDTSPSPSYDSGSSSNDSSYGGYDGGSSGGGGASGSYD